MKPTNKEEQELCAQAVRTAQTPDKLLEVAARGVVLAKEYMKEEDNNKNKDKENENSRIQDGEL